MRKGPILLFLVLAGSAAYGQGASTPSPQSSETPAAAQKKPEPDPALGAIASKGLPQGAVPASSLTNSELLGKARTLYVVSDTIFIKRQDMEKHLLRQKELEDWPLHVVQNKEHADLILQIKRIPFTNNFPFTLTDRVSSIVLMGGEIDSMPGGVPEKIAGQIADKLREIKKSQQPKQSPSK